MYNIHSNHKGNYCLSAFGELLTKFFNVSLLFAQSPYKHLVEADCCEEVCYIKKRYIKKSILFFFLTGIAARKSRKGNP